MKDSDCVRFLQWALPKAHLRWPGFRKVRRQVCRRIADRITQLGLSALADYQAYLDRHPTEWATFDTLCWISISQFYRDHAVFQCLERAVLPMLAEQSIIRGRHTLDCWSLGCGSGEEPYTLSILWMQALAEKFPDVSLKIVATDIDPRAIARAQRACYPAGSVKDLPVEWRDQAFTISSEGLSLKPEYRESVSFLRQDVRQAMPAAPFDLILCRYLVFTYFDGDLQAELLDKITDRLRPGGALVLGSTDTLPKDTLQVEPWPGCPWTYRKREV